MRAGAWTWSRQRWRELAGLTFTMAGSAVLVWLLPGGAFYRGVVVGVLLASLAWLLALLIVVGSGNLPRLWGVGGERATAEEFTSRRRKKQGWALVNGLRLGGQEIDHIAVGPGGVLVIETKWAPSKPWSLSNGRLVGPLGDPLGQVRRNAWRVDRLLNGPTGGNLGVTVEPLLIV